MEVAVMTIVMSTMIWLLLLPSLETFVDLPVLLQTRPRPRPRVRLVHHHLDQAPVDLLSQAQEEAKQVVSVSQAVPIARLVGLDQDLALALSQVTA